MGEKIGILGAGAGGTAFGQALGLSGHDVTLWDKEKTILNEITKKHENRRKFPGFLLSERLVGQAKLEKVIAQNKIILVALPISAQTSVAVQVKPFLKSDHIIVHIAAGVRGTDGAMVMDIWEDVMGISLQQVIIAGPNFALEMIQEKFTAAVIASRDGKISERVGDLFEVDYMRPYFSEDVIGVQLGGAIRHVIAIAAGMCDGMGIGTNGQAAVLCRGLSEMARLVKVMGGDERTVMGLSGVGDVVLHATSKLSRNYRFGVQVGKGVPVNEAVEQVGFAEGLVTSRMVAYLAVTHGVDLAIVSAVDGVLSGDITAKKVFELIKQRPKQYEFEKW